MISDKWHLPILYLRSLSYVSLDIERIILNPVGLLVRRQRVLRVRLQRYGQVRQQDVPDTGRKTREVQSPASPSGDTVWG